MWQQAETYKTQSVDFNAIDFIPYKNDTYYIFDRGYVKYERLYKITLLSAHFVVRAKSNLKFRRIYSQKTDKYKGLQTDQIGKLTRFYVPRNYPEKLRKVKYYDSEINRTFVFLINNMSLSAQDIALLYKNRWQVELFFKWIKQHLKVKTFWGNSENAVRIQIYTAIITYCQVAIVGYEINLTVQPTKYLKYPYWIKLL